MSTIRKKGIITTIFIYVGFLLGALNTFLYFKFKPEQVGLTRVLLDIAVLFSSFTLLGSNTVVTKFYPYYRSHHKEQKSDLLTIAFAISTVGFLILMALHTILEPTIIRKFSGKSPLLVNYFFLAYPLAFFLTMFQVLEAETWNLQKAPLSNFLKEVAFRFFNTILIFLFLGGIISFHIYAHLFSWQYAGIFFILLFYLMYKKELNMSFRISTLTKRLWKKMLPYSLFILGGNVITILSTTIDAIVISSLKGLDFAAVFMISQYITSIIVVPQRTATSIASPVISQAWKDKDMFKLASVYRKTSLNLLIASTFIFTMIWLNYDDLFRMVKTDPIYLLGKPVVLILGLQQIVEMGTGLNSAIIITSRRWKFELYSNIILLACTIPLTYILIKEFGMIGAACATLLSRTIFNALRFGFLLKVYNLQPFSYKTLVALVIPVVVYALVHFTINFSNPLLNMIVRSALFAGIYGYLILQLRVSEDVQQVFGTIKKRIRNLAGRN
ncbi:lipopolysaccharide biosynthesis protein [Chitinophaga tropicalis]|uniref:Oligosaccharide flippase family protein n=1 Tax=Chitinophaga tropicalis TaxID=2683588 RepID=A0A7K1U3H3_9BACT|nr:polysaccharide biosynthesis C-terminal domain-containing protein [Chitinophaga tropicalis]MVT08836.1 oligosaccharide flippase family protein [Chitinophaga tropicalis]